MDNCDYSRPIRPELLKRELRIREQGTGNSGSGKAVETVAVNLGLGLLATLREWPRVRVQPSTFNL
ncbi:hypothetical protein [Moorena producens]|uniref:hypothetical protein n=1 Tax=Moorena producens TaxID=1155739 RepID=UPI003C70CD84